jgi:hypothetical protein
MWQVALVIVGCVFIFLHFGCEPGTPVAIGLFVALVVARRFSIHAIRRRRSNPPIFDSSAVGARFVRLTSHRRTKSWEHVLLSASVALLCAGAFLGGLQIAKRIYFWLWPFGIDGWVRG